MGLNPGYFFKCFPLYLYFTLWWRVKVFGNRQQWSRNLLSWVNSMMDWETIFAQNRNDNFALSLFFFFKCTVFMYGASSIRKLPLKVSRIRKVLQDFWLINFSVHLTILFAYFGAWCLDTVDSIQNFFNSAIFSVEVALFLFIHIYFRYFPTT